MNIRDAVVERFLRYVRMDTQSDEKSTAVPSTPGQFEMLKSLEAELHELGVKQTRLFNNAVLVGYIEPTAGYENAPTVAFIAHVDTYYGTPGKGVKPILHDNYNGGPIVLPGTGERIDPEANPGLKQYIGETIITSDGTTLLGADDKAGVAEIMTLVELIEKNGIAHGPLRVVFTTDEEVGRGTDNFPSLEELGADVAYTVDGSEEGEVENETFCADSALVTLTGIDYHPGYAKGKMVNSIRAAAKLISLLRTDALPETTEGRQGYLHPYEINGSVNETKIKFLVRDFEMEGLKRLEDELETLCRRVADEFPKLKWKVDITHSYKNMGYYLQKDPRVMELALKAVRAVGLEPKVKAIRGGTDGSRLSEQGLPTPNLFAGGRNFHSVKEWIPVPAMVKAVEVLVKLVELWREEKKSA